MGANYSPLKYTVRINRPLQITNVSTVISPSIIEMNCKCHVIYVTWFFFVHFLLNVSQDYPGYQSNIKTQKLIKEKRLLKEFTEIYN